MAINDYLIISQSIFFGLASLVIIAVGIILVIFVYYLMVIAKYIHKISENVEEISDGAKENIKEALAAISKLPIISFLIRSKKRKGKVRNKL